jgi:hypothetical protein
MADLLTEQQVLNAVYDPTTGVLKVNVAGMIFEGDVNVDAVTINNPVGNPVNVKLPEGAQAVLDTHSEAIKLAAEAVAAAVAPGTAPWFDDVTIEDTDPVVVDFDGAVATYCEIENTGASDLTLTGYNSSTRTLEPGDKARMANAKLTSVTVSAASGAGSFSVDATVIPPAEGS